MAATTHQAGWFLVGKPDTRGRVRTARQSHFWTEDGPALCGYKRWNVRPGRVPVYGHSDKHDKCPKCVKLASAPVEAPVAAPVPFLAPPPRAQLFAPPTWDAFVDSTPKRASLSELFALLNETYFNNEVPNIPVTWNARLKRAAGRCFVMSVGDKGTPTRIDLAKKILDTRAKLLRTLAHEMVHAWLYATQPRSVAKGHGPLFQAKMRTITGEDGNHTYHTYETSHLKRFVPVCPNSERAEHWCTRTFQPRVRRNRHAVCPHCRAGIVWRENPDYTG
jgi:predicted SprT family Zn-dependent metalloprotease